MEAKSAEALPDEPDRWQGGQCSFLAALHEAAVTSNIGSKNGDEFSLKGCCFNFVFLGRRPG
jgi:hypothetical protein